MGYVIIIILYLKLYHRTRTRILLRHERAPIPLGYSDGYSIIEGEFLIEGNYLRQWDLNSDFLTY